MRKIIAIGILALIGGAAYSQNCTGTHSLYCNPYLGKDKTQKKTEEAAYWTTTTQSKSGAFVRGDTVDINIVVQKDQKYRVTVCSADEELQPDEGSQAGKIQFLIVEQETKIKMVTKKEMVTREKKDADGNIVYEKQVSDAGDTTEVPVMETVAVEKQDRTYYKQTNTLYDNAQNSNAQTYLFTTDRTRKLTIRVITPAGEGAKKGKGLGTESVSCVGVLIEHAKGVTGLNKAR